MSCRSTVPRGEAGECGAAEVEGREWIPATARSESTDELLSKLNMLDLMEERPGTASNVRGNLLLYSSLILI